MWLPRVLAVLGPGFWGAGGAVVLSASNRLDTCVFVPTLRGRFINDTIRNDFHQRFLKKYVR